MLGRGFQDDVKNIFALLPGDVQVGLFSATMPYRVLNLTRDFMRDPATILVKNEDLTLDGMRQFYIPISKDEWKYLTLVELYKNIDIQQCIIFCNRKEKTNEVSKKLNDEGFPVSTLHSDNTQEERELIMREFRSGSTRVLITTDILARGIDIQQVSLVVNYDLPISKEKYIHRIGRTARYGRKGVAINFVTKDDSRFMADVEKFYNTEISELPCELDQVFGEITPITATSK
jgi:translation initiation factor 4A